MMKIRRRNLLITLCCAFFALLCVFGFFTLDRKTVSAEQPYFVYSDPTLNYFDPQQVLLNGNNSEGFSIFAVETDDNQASSIVIKRDSVSRTSGFVHLGCFGELCPYSSVSSFIRFSFSCDGLPARSKLVVVPFEAQNPVIDGHYDVWENEGSYFFRDYDVMSWDLYLVFEDIPSTFTTLTFFLRNVMINGGEESMTYFPYSDKFFVAYDGGYASGFEEAWGENGGDFSTGETGYDAGYRDGYEDGRDDGYYIGYDDGYELGTDEGYLHGIERAEVGLFSTAKFAAVLNNCTYIDPEDGQLTSDGQTTVNITDLSPAFVNGGIYIPKLFEPSVLGLEDFTFDSGTFSFIFTDVPVERFTLWGYGDRFFAETANVYLLLSDEKTYLTNLEWTKKNDESGYILNIADDLSDYSGLFVQRLTFDVPYGSRDLEATIVDSFGNYSAGFEVGFEIGYGEGYDVGHDMGYSGGYGDGRVDGEEYGYNKGYDKGLQEKNSFLGLMTSVVDAPVQVFVKMVDVDILGYNMKDVALSLLTACLLIAAIKLFSGFGGKG